MASLRGLHRRADRLLGVARRAHPRIPTDRVEFARAVGVTPDPWQADALLSDHPRVLFNCARQSGKSTVAALLATHKALTVPRSLVLIVAPSERQARETFSKAASFYRQLGYPIPSDSDRKLGLELRSGSRIEALPGTEKTVRGFSGVDLLIVDEAARVDDALYHAVRPMLAVSGGRLLMMSTPYGKRGVFFDAWVGVPPSHGTVKSPGPGGSEWERYEIPASMCPRIPPEFLEAERRSLPDWVYRQEFCCEFVETDDQIFTHDLIANAVTDEVAPLVFSEDGW